MTPRTDDHLPRWGVYIYLCRDTTRFRAIAETEWAAIKSLAVPSSVSIAIQQDSALGVRRWTACKGRESKSEDIEPRNQGSANVASEFLLWACKEAPAERSVLVLAGTGVLDPWSVVGAEADPTRTFAICDDEGDKDALEVSELNSLFQEYTKTVEQPLDILVLDMSAMQWLEVAYQFQDLVRFTVAAQAPVIPGPCPIAELVSAFTTDDAAPEPPIEDVARRAAEVLGNTYRMRATSQTGDDVITAPTVVSVVRLSALESVARAFDTFSHAVMLAVGEEVVWETRKKIVDDARTLPFGPTVDSGQWSSPFFDDYAYDLVGLMQHSAECFEDAQRGAVSTAVARFLARQDDRTLVSELASIVRRVNRVMAGRRRRNRPVGPGRAYNAFLGKWASLVSARHKDRQDMVALKKEVRKLAKRVRSGRDRFWIDWARDETELTPDRNDRLSERLGREIRVTNEGRKHAERLEKLARRVLDVLEGRRGKTIGDPLILAKYPADSPACGIAIYRPKELDALLNANYLELDFNRRSHWAALLAVINLVERHPRAMWRVIESVLSTAPLDARQALLQRVFGPATVVAGFREQLKVLASPPLATLSISEGGPTMGRGVKRQRGYVVRYTPCTPLAAINEHEASITVTELNKRVSVLQQHQKRDHLTRGQLDQFDEFGATLGEDVIKKVEEDIEVDAKAAGEGKLHLQLQLPRELMRYPWELIHDTHGRLTHRFALARQVYVPEGLVRARPRLRHNTLRALIIAAPRTSGPEPTLAASRREGEAVASTFQALADELGEVIDFDSKRDTRIGTDVKVTDVRTLLRYGEYDIVHFSGHGKFTENNPEETGWIVSDGILNLDWIKNTLSWTTKPPWLVYSNACQSAKGDVVYQGELHGLASAFITNGVAAYIGSLWNVADLAGFRMAVEFYNALCLKRMTLGQALLAARNVVENQLETTIDDLPPGVRLDSLLALTSASFVLFGDPTAKALDQIGTAPPEQSRSGATARES